MNRMPMLVRFPRTGLSCLLCVTLWGCGRPETGNAPSRAALATGRPIHISPADADRAIAPLDGHGSDGRRLRFVMAGQSRAAPTPSNLEDRAAATQAAIVVALANAVTESRAHRGQSADEFTERIGPDVTITISSHGETTVEMTDSGTITRWRVHNERLSGRPHDRAAIRRLFDNTDGTYRLLDTWSDSLRGIVIAQVGCYATADSATVLAAEDSGEDDPIPPSP